VLKVDSEDSVVVISSSFVSVVVASAGVVWLLPVAGSVDPGIDYKLGILSCMISQTWTGDPVHAMSYEL
jgi:hypothetical protein